MTALEIRGATPEPFLIPLPDDLNRRVEQLILEAGGPLSANQFERAAELSEELYLLMLGAQPPGKRFHKGWPLHNRGLAFALTSKGKLAAVSFLLAFIEDAISRAEESPTKLDELDRPAARVLALVLDQSTLVAAATSVRERFASGERQRMRNPEDVVADLDLELAEDVEITFRRENRKVGLFTSPWENRVFVGGYYGHIAALNEIRDEVSRRGFDAVLTLDFEVPAGMGHHHSLMLLHECRQAIFELTYEAGQLMELERTRDYEIDHILAVFQGTPEHPKELSGMTEALLGRLGVAAAPYDSMAELRRLVGDWLKTL